MTVVIGCLRRLTEESERRESRIQPHSINISFLGLPLPLDKCQRTVILYQLAIGLVYWAMSIALTMGKIVAKTLISSDLGVG